MKKRTPNNNRLIKYLSSSLIVILSLISCNDALDLDSTHSSEEANQWKHVADTRSALMGVYGLSRAALANNNAHWMYGELRNGDFISSSRPDLTAIIDGKLNANYNLIEELKDWSRFYAAINAASVFLEKAPGVLDEDPRYSEQNLVLDLAQAKALRAFMYFYMTRIWGDIPLITQAFDNGVFDEIHKSDQTTVLNYAEGELLSILDQLPFEYGVEGQFYNGFGESKWEGVLFNKISAYAVLSHIAAWKGNYNDVIIYSQPIFDHYLEYDYQYNSIEQLVSTEGIFSGLSGATKSLFGFNFRDAQGESSGIGHIESLTLAQPWVIKSIPDIYIPKDSLFLIYDNPYDFRYGIDTLNEEYHTTFFSGLNGEVPVFSKIKVIRDGLNDGAYALFSSSLVFTRMEEIALLRAEAYAILNNLTESTVYLNTIRSLRGLPLYQIVGKSELIENIFNERRRELVGEGWRWYDQVRHSRVYPSKSYLPLGVLGSDGIYWPLSNRVLRNNSKISQNEYWK